MRSVVVVLTEVAVAVAVTVGGGSHIPCSYYTI